MVVATPDRQHTAPALAFLGRGLPLLLEKPMAPNEDEARQIVAAAERANVVVCVAHVLRYSAYTTTIMAALADGAIGDVVAVEHLEPVGWWHYAHSYVRGNWRREEESNPMLMAKCCHDVDWLSFVVGRPAVRVSSFGSLTHFTAANKPAGGRVTLPGLRRRARAARTRPSGSTSTTSTSRPRSGGRCPSWPST